MLNPKCKDCEQTPMKCICAAVDLFFGNEPKEAPRSSYRVLRTLQVLAACLLLTFASCGKQGPIGANGISIPCTTTAVVGGVEVRCPDGSHQVVYNGTQGLPGSDGQNGSTGPAGPQGTIGHQGPQGPTGTPGSNGHDGVPGADGHDGSNGHDGSIGLPGLPGTVVGAIQFCAGYTTQYPSMFAEFGFCVDDKIYAVYWDGHNSWWTLVPEGTYSSTSTSAPCTFTVGPHCQVSP